MHKSATHMKQQHIACCRVATAARVLAGSPLRQQALSRPQPLLLQPTAANAASSRSTPTPTDPADPAPGYPSSMYPTRQTWLWQRPEKKASLTTDMSPGWFSFWLNVIEVVHWASFPIGFSIFFLIFSNAGTLAQSVDGSSARVFCMLMGLVTQVYGGGLTGNMMHEYEGWQVAPFRNPLRDDPIETIPTYNNAWLRSVAYQFLFAFQTTGLLLFTLGAFGLNPVTLTFAAATLLIAFVGPRQPRFSQEIFGQPVSPLPLPLFLAFILNALVNFYANYTIFGHVMPGPALLAIVPGVLVALGGLFEGLLAESLFDQRLHLIAFLILDFGLYTHSFLYLRLIASLPPVGLL